MTIIDTAKKTIGFLGVVRRYIQFRVNKISPANNYDITYQCQLNCEHCYFARSWVKDRKNDELEPFLKGAKCLKPKRGEFLT